jgi:hypothetical protein
MTWSKHSRLILPVILPEGPGIPPTCSLRVLRVLRLLRLNVFDLGGSCPQRKGRSIAPATVLGKADRYLNKQRLLRIMHGLHFKGKEDDNHHYH